MENDVDVFQKSVREGTILLLLWLVLFCFSCRLVVYFRKDFEIRKSSNRTSIAVTILSNHCRVVSTENIVNRICTYLCAFSLAVSLIAIFLLPISIVSNEFLILYPNHHYFQWLNESLIQGLWNCVFLFSNSSLFILLPFAYFLLESEGFVGYQNNLVARIYETVTLVILLLLAVMGISCIVTSLVNSNIDVWYFLQIFEFWNYHLPLLYSCISFLGVLMLLVCTPLGFVYLFDLVRTCTQPKLTAMPAGQMDAYSFEKSYLERRLIKLSTDESCLKKRYQHKGTFDRNQLQCQWTHENDVVIDDNGDDGGLAAINSKNVIRNRLDLIEQKKVHLEKQMSSSSLIRTFFYAILFIVLLLLNSTAIFLVVINTIELLIGIKALPRSTRKFTLGIESLSKLGVIGATIEIIVILYLITTSFFGLYSLPLFSRMRPKSHNTSFPHLVLNSALLLTLSSALPLLVRILGITNFDLLGDYGQIEWLGNFLIVLMYNIVFATSATLCLVNKFTAGVRAELINRLKDCYKYFTNLFIY